MKKIQITILIVSVLSFSSCSKHMYIAYQAESSNTGKVVLKPSKPTYKTNVSISDNLIVNNKRLKSLTIDNIPYGTHNLLFKSDYPWYKEKLDVQILLNIEHGGEITEKIEVPPYNDWYWFFITAAILAPWAVLF
jgi:hypothetical protein